MLPRLTLKSHLRRRSLSEGGTLNYQLRLNEIRFETTRECPMLRSDPCSFLTPAFFFAPQFAMLPCDNRSLFLHCLVLFQELVEATS
jgi:hypothetical protein